MSSLAESDFLQLPVYEDIRAAENLVLTYPPFRDWDRSRTETVIQVFFTSRKTQNELENLLFDPFTRIDYPENLSATTGAAPSLPDTRKAPVKSALKFLLVEDNTDAAMFLQEMLSDIAICDTAMLVSEALDKFAIAMKYEIPYDVILLDITLPDGEGLEVLQAVRKMEAEKKIYGQSQCKVLMTTALNDSEHIIRSFRDQCDAYLVKPLTLKALKKELVKLKVLPS